MAALGEYRAGLCPSCGRRLVECTDAASEGAYTVPIPRRCHATTALAIAQKPYQETPHANALLWTFSREE